MRVGAVYLVCAVMLAFAAAGAREDLGELGHCVVIVVVSIKLGSIVGLDLCTSISNRWVYVVVVVVVASVVE
jgi:hypothetical protein